VSLVICTGPAGTGKTKTSCVVGLNGLVDKQYERMIVTRPTIAVGNEEIGFLPGDLHDKMEPWVSHMIDYANMYQLRFVHDKIDAMPLAYIRGETWSDRFVIADEMQNSTVLQMKTLLTRIGENSKLVITGDLSQSDLNETENGLVDLLRRLENSSPLPFCEHVQFTEDDVVRSEFVKQILKLY
jgi:phosphate starvation-inducible PhoH-like protein